MSIFEVLARAAVSTAVYWAAPSLDEYGTRFYPTPEEIKVRWEDRTELVIERGGEKWTSSSQVYVLQDVDLDGYLYLGELLSLDPSGQDNPETVAQAKRIRRVDKITSLADVSVVVRVAYL